MASKKKYPLKPLRFALLNQKGVPVMVGPSAHLCIGEYVRQQKRIILREADYARWFLVMSAKGWSIVRTKAELTITSKPLKLLWDKEGKLKK